MSSGLFLKISVGVLSSIALMLIKADDGFSQNLEPLLHTDFSTIDKSPFKQFGSVSWKQHHVRLNKGGLLIKKHGGPHYRITANLTIDKAEPLSVTQFAFSVSDGTTIAVSIVRKSENNEDNTYIQFESRQGTTKRLLKSDQIQNFDLSGIWTVTYAFGFIQVAFNDRDVGSIYFPRETDLIVSSVLQPAGGATLSNLIIDSIPKLNFTAETRIEIEQFVAEQIETREFLNKGQFEKALESALHAQKKCRELLGAQHPNTWVLLSDIAMVHERRREWSSAFSDYREANKQLRLLLPSDHPTISHIQFLLGSLELNQGLLTDSEATLSDVYAANSRVFGLASERTVVAAMTLAEAKFNMGLTQEAFVLLESECGSHLGSILQQRRKSSPYTQDVKKLYELFSGLNRKMAEFTVRQIPRSEIGSALLDSVESQLKSSIDTASKIQGFDRLELLRTILLYSQVKVRLNEAGDVEALIKKALQLVPANPPNDLEPFIFNVLLADILKESRRFKEAKTIYLKVIETTKFSQYEGSQFIAGVHQQLSFTFNELRDAENALKHASKAYEISKCLSQKNLAGIVDEGSPCISDLVASQEAVLSVLDNDRAQNSRTALMLIEETRWLTTRNLRIHQSGSKDLISARLKFANEFMRSGMESHKIFKANAELVSAVRASESEESLCPDFSEQDVVSKLNKCVDLNRSVISFVERGVGVKCYDAFVCTRQSGELKIDWIECGEAKPIHIAIENYRDALQNGTKPQYKAAGRVLRQLLWTPIASRISESKQVVIIPTSYIWAVPWNAIPGASKDTFLIDAHCFSTEISVGSLSFERSAFDFRSRPIVSFSSPYSSPNRVNRIWNVPHSLISQQCISTTKKKWQDSYGGRFVHRQGISASEKEFYKIANEASVLHIGVHGYTLKSDVISDLSETAPIGLGSSRAILEHADLYLGRFPSLASVIAFSNPVQASAKENQLYDGFVSAFEIYQQDFSEVNLVMLRSCFGGHGLLTDKSGVSSIQKAFRESGARSVISSLWLADQSHSDWLLQAIYSDIAEKNCSNADALYDNLLRMRNGEGEGFSSAHPKHWGNWILCGNTNVLELDGPIPEEPATSSIQDISVYAWPAIGLIFILITLYRIRVRKTNGRGIAKPPSC